MAEIPASPAKRRGSTKTGVAWIVGGAVLVTLIWLWAWSAVYEPGGGDGINNFLSGVHAATTTVPGGDVIVPAVVGAFLGWIGWLIYRDNFKRDT